jgi:peptidoglycan/xylan/chitin deacetylase (PgdA/CDA1 family)
MRLLIVNFHYIRDHKPGAGIYPISTDEFRHQVETLGRFYSFISQQELVDFIISDNLPDKDFCMLTFDDGLKEQWLAFDILERLSIPAIFFPTTQPLTEGKAHDTHKMHYVYSRLDDEEVYALLHERFRINDYHFDDGLVNQEYRYDSLIKKRIKFFINFILEQVDRSSLVDYLFKQVSHSETGFLKNLYMNAQDISKLAALGMLGTHGKTHRALATLDAISLKDEISGSRQILENLAGTPIQSISYPFGGLAAISSEVANAARNDGMIFGLTMIRGINNEDDIRSRMMLRRVDTNDAPGGKFSSLEFVP